ncbi:universal stress protein [Roseovarius sp. Pro17]|uniref:universal stress protein n=1 Tax=Roseovarius sp. Pro17 TaxID=3108175 RepID=UPI002D7A3BD0|nr:universal stress protein [Roseovarius sp. Pro17]
MKTILVATDFSVRSDLAVTRAALIAAKSGARLHLIHVVDDDQKPRIVEGETDISKQLLQEEIARLNQTDGLNCTTDVVLGDPFEGICNSADAINPDLVVIGAHRRRALRDVFVGTTAQRTIRRARWPVLMVNAKPEQTYRTVLLTTDFSEPSRMAALHLAGLDLAAPDDHTLLHIIDAPARRLVMSDVLSERQMIRYLAALQIEAEQELKEFAATLPFGDWHGIARQSSAPTSEAVLKAAVEFDADLIVVASQGRVGLSKTFLGSVAEEILRRADRDVLAIPPNLPV